MATTPRAFISFDFDHDDDLRNALVGQARYNTSPFNFSNWSLKEPLTGDWKKKIRDRIALTSLTVVICGYYTDTAAGVSAELDISRELGKPYFLLAGHSDGRCTKPKAARANDTMYNWTWQNIDTLLSGGRQRKLPA